MYEPPLYDRDSEHLRLLRIFHYIYGGLVIAGSSVFVIHFAMAIAAYNQPGFFPIPEDKNGPPREIWLVMAAFVGVVIVLGWIDGVLTIASGRMIGERRGRMFSIVMAALNCLHIPIGTALGVSTIIVLSRESVVAKYQAATATNDPLARSASRGPDRIV